MNAALSARGKETLPQKLSFLAEQIGPAVATLGRRHFGRAAKASACQADGVSPRGLESHRCRACAKWLCVEGEYIASLGRDDLDVFFSKNNSLNLLKKQRLNHPALGSRGAMEPDRQKGCSGN